MKLDHNDRTSQLWAKLTAHWNKRIEELRYQLEGDRSDIDTAKLRGRIAEIRANLALIKAQEVLINEEVPAAPE